MSSVIFREILSLLDDTNEKLAKYNKAMKKMVDDIEKITKHLNIPDDKEVPAKEEGTETVS